MRPQDPAYQCSINRSRRAFSAHIPDGDPKPRHRVRNEVIQISANRSCGNELRRHVEMCELWAGLRKQASLQFARERQIALEAALLLFDLFVEPGVLKRDCDLSGQSR